MLIPMNNETNQFKIIIESLDDIKSGRTSAIYIHLTESDERIGYVILRGNDKNPEEREIGWEIENPAYRRKRIMSWALREIAKQGIEEGWFSSLYAKIYHTNNASKKTAERLGLVKVPHREDNSVGVLRFAANADKISEAISKRPLSAPSVGFNDASIPSDGGLSLLSQQNVKRPVAAVVRRGLTQSKN